MLETPHSETGFAPSGGAPRALYVEDDVDASDVPDWMSWELDTEEILPGSLEQSAIIELFVQYLRTLARERSWTTIVSSEVFFAWAKRSPNARVSPDAFLCDDLKLPRRGVVNTWEPGRCPPRFALEVVGKDRKKDYLNAPKRYDALGTNELAIFDPVAAESTGSLFPRALTFYRRVEGGAFRKVYEGNGPVRSEEIGAWLLLGFVDGAPYLRVSRDQAGLDVVPTPADAEQTRADAERARAEKAEQRIRELEARLSRS